MKNLSTDLAATISTWMTTDEVRSFVERTKAAGDEDTGTFEMVITTENIDRYDEVISLDGWELDHYLKNPVVLWGHDHYQLPVAVTTSLEKRDGKLIAKGKFAPHEFAQKIRKSYDAGFLFASSVGFLIKERQGNLISKAELIEWSFVSVPANPYALGLAIEKGFDLNYLVTTGFLDITKSTEPVIELPVEVEVEKEPEPEGVPEEDQAEKIANLVVAKLKEAGALEALPQEEPERTEDEPVAEETEEQKALAVFTEQRRILQQAATIVGDILAEKRQQSKALRSNQ